MLKTVLHFNPSLEIIYSRDSFQRQKGYKVSSFIANCKNYVNILEVLHITGEEVAEERVQLPVHSHLSFQLQGR